MTSGRYALYKMATSAVGRLRWMCSSTRSRCYSSLPRTAKLALVAVRSLTKTPEGGHGGDLMMRTCEPIFSLFEKGVWWIGLLCFLIVIMGITTVSGTFYVYVVPAYWEGNVVFFSLWFVLGHYLLISVTFHYYKGFVTGPGSPKQVKNFSPYRDPTPSGWKVCFKCSQPKPPRSHHCRICNKCILKMDHHCPWFFNCIGQNNHRYFIMFIVYMWFAVVFVVLSLWKHMSFMYERSTPWLNSFMTSLGISQLEYYPKDHHIAVWEHFFTTIVFFVCIGVSIALAVLGGWHIYLITRAETSIEFYTNRNEAVDMRRAGKRFVNKYSYGKLNNWRIFLGLKSGRSLARHILLPSGHEPISDGMDWDVESEALRKITKFSSSNTSMLADMI